MVLRLTIEREGRVVGETSVVWTPETRVVVELMLPEGAPARAPTMDEVLGRTVVRRGPRKGGVAKKRIGRPPGSKNKVAATT